MNVQVKVRDAEYNRVLMSLPGKYEVCPRCRGEGTHSNPSIDGNGLSEEMISDDPEFYEDYMSGRYDVTCTECKGKRVVPVADVSRCTYAQKRALVRQRQWEWEELEHKSQVRAEQRAMGIYY